MSKSIVGDKSLAFAIRIVNLYKLLRQRHEFVLSKQMLRSGTAIGALMREAEHGQSTADFVSKVNIALKEANETGYWLLVLKETDYISEQEYTSINNDCSELIKMTASIVKTIKTNQRMGMNKEKEENNELLTLNSQLSTNIYPIFDRMLARHDKEELLGQRSVMIWFTGLSGSGKSTIAIALERELHKRGLLCRILDGDNIRTGINNNLGFSEADRVENIRRIAEVSKLFIDSGIITIAAFISPNNDIREMAANIIGQEDFLEVFVSTPLEECEKRDVKGLYAKARRGEIKNFTGISAPFEAPEHPALTLDTSRLTLEESVRRLLEIVLPRVGRP